MWGVMLEVGSQSKDAVHFVHSQMTTFFWFRHYFLIAHPPDRQLELFFSGRNNHRAPARQTTRTFFFPVVITIAHPPDRRLEPFFSGRNNDRAPARRTTRTIFSGRNNNCAPARQMTRVFFPVVITIAHPPDRRLEPFFRL